MTNKKMNNVEILLSKLDKGKLSDFIRKNASTIVGFKTVFSLLEQGFSSLPLTATLRVSRNLSPLNFY